MTKHKLATAALMLPTALLLNVPVSFASTVEIVGNGADSSNTTNVNVTKQIDIYQTNSANINNNASVNTNTGNNTTDKNTGGDTSITTGDATTNLAVSNTANKSIANLACCDGTTFETKVAGNGADTNNKVNLNLNNITNITDTKYLNIKNNFNVGATTGDNKANENTNGNASIVTGNALVNVTIGNTGNFNLITIGNKPVPGGNVTPPPAPIPGVSPVVVAAAAAVPGKVLGALLPNTGFDYPFKLIGIITASLIGAGIVLNKKSESVERYLESLLRRA